MHQFSHRHDHHVVSTLNEREVRIERSINVVRMGVYALAAALDLASALLQGLATPAYVVSFGSGMVLAAAYVLAIHFLTRGRYRGWLPYLTITVDCAVPAAVVVEMQRPEFAGVVGAESVVAINVVIVVIIIMLNALRLRTFAVGYAALLGAAITAWSTYALKTPVVMRAWLPPLVIITGAITYWTAGNFRSLIQTLRRREKLARFLPKELVTILEGSDLEVTLGGKTTQLTVLFADIRGFTRYCENRSPEEVVDVLNEYFTVMTAAIREHGGMIDKYVGDAVMAVFGAPLPRADHAARAAAAAQGMLRQLALLNARWAEAGRPPFRIGIALHSGAALAGTIGAPDRMDYTVIGDTVNLAARLEELNKTYHTAFIMSDDTYRGMGEPKEARLLGEVTVRGREKPVRVYTIEPGET